MKKRVLTLGLALALLCGLTVPVSAGGNEAKIGGVRAVAVGGRHVAVVDENGDLWTWGCNDKGQLGNGPKVERAPDDGSGTVSLFITPTKDQFPRNSTLPVKVLDKVVAVDCGSWYTAALREDGTLWTWGQNMFSELGNGWSGYADDSGYPFLPLPAKILDNVAAFSCGDAYGAAILSDGTLWMWGSNSLGQLGNGEYGNSISPQKAARSTRPFRLMGNVKSVVCSDNLTAAIKTDGTLWMWGNGNLGNGGVYNASTPGLFGGTVELQSVPIQVMDHVSQVSLGTCNTAVREDGSLWTWGSLVGDGTDKVYSYPTKLMDGGVASVAGYGSNTAILKTDGSLWLWGDNGCGQIGNGTEGYDPVLAPVKVMDDVAFVTGGAYNTANINTAAVKTDGTLWLWGSNGYGQVDNVGGGESQTSPRQVTSVTPASQTALAARANLYVGPLAYQSPLSVSVDGREEVFDAYALKDENGNDTNYVKLREVAMLFKFHTGIDFDVGWDGAVNIETGKEYTIVGGELQNPFSGSRAYEFATAPTKVNGQAVNIEAIVLKDDNGGAYTFYKLRDLGDILGLTVGWDAQRGAYMETEAFTQKKGDLPDLFQQWGIYVEPGAYTQQEGDLPDFLKGLDLPLVWDAEQGAFIYQD